MSDETDLPEPPAPPVSAAIAAVVKEVKAKKKRLKRDTAAPKVKYPPQFEGLEPPKSAFTNRYIGKAEVEYYKGCKVTGHLHMAGFGNKEADLLFVGTCPDKEECMPRYNSKPSLMQGAAANLFMRSLRRMGISDTDWYYTNLVKYWLPNGRAKPMDVRWCETALRDEVNTIKPKLIVCLGKPAFDFFYKKKFALRDVQGGLFECPEFNCLLYPMDARATPLLKPEFLDRVLTDMREVKQVLQEVKGVPRVKLATDYHVISTAEHLDNFLGEELARQPNLIVTDCEWAGQTFVDGSLRSCQFSLRPGHAVYVRLMDENMQYVFDQPLSVVRDIVGGRLNASPVKLAGHNLAADLVWLHNHLGVHTEGKAGFDTMFAIHTINEYADLKLERGAVKYTDLGRYDIPLTLWKKETGFDDDDNEGYGRVKDKILIPYAQKDCDATMRMIPVLTRQLIEGRVWGYYQQQVLPFVTDGFVEMMECGLPMDVEHLEEMRDTYSRNRDILTAEFRQALAKEASLKLFTRMVAIDPEQGRDLFLDLMNLLKDATVEGELDQKSSAYQQATSQLIHFCGTSKVPEMLPVFEHFAEASRFNINSTHDISRWLFLVKGLKPFKSTKKDGIQLAWEKVMLLPKEKQAKFTPAADKATLKLFAGKDRLVADLEGVKLIGNVVKAFLREKDEKGREQGIAKWIQKGSDRVHTNFALTETGRPRSWRPNVLNWPKHISKQVEAAFRRVHTGHVRRRLKELHEQGMTFRPLLAEGRRLTRKASSLRSCVKAPEGHCLIDMDLKTAEVVALARLSGDRQMIGVLTEPDVQFGRISKDDKKAVLRVCFNSNEGLDAETQEKHKHLIVSPNDGRFLRDKAGRILHPQRDLHWEFATTTLGLPREVSEERLARDGVGKVGNFCLSVGSRILTLRGEVPIEKVCQSDLLWDGEAWVPHEGVVCNGTKEVHFHDGLWATNNHEVWIESGEKVLFGEARKAGYRLKRVKAPSSWNSVGVFGGVSGDGLSLQGRALQGDGEMSKMRKDIRQVSGHVEARETDSMFVRAAYKLWRRPFLHTSNQVCRYAPAVRKGFSQIFSDLQRAWDKGHVRLMPGVCGVGFGEMAGYGLQGAGVRSRTQRRSLLEGEYTLGAEIGQSTQQKDHAFREHRHGEGSFGETPRNSVYSHNGGEADATRAYAGAGHRVSEQQRKSNDGTAKEGRKNNQASLVSRWVPVYDILNAGPRHRFTCNGVLVSNSIPYGATGPLLERMIETNTGKKPPEGTGEKMIVAYKTRYPVAAAFLDAMGEIPDSQSGSYRLISGRVRHSYYTEVTDLEGLSEYQRDGIKSPLSRQFRNFPMQAIVADTTARALLMFIKKRKELGLTSRIGMLLYDAVMAISPLDQAKATAELLKHCLTDWNTWTCHGDTWHFDVDVSMGFNWGVKPTKPEKELLSKYL